MCSQDDSVKLQIINLSSKLAVTNPKQTTLLCQYVFNLAKYDQNYDIRDRARFLRQLVFPDDVSLFSSQ
jgi:AP-3 complex subunit beta